MPKVSVIMAVYNGEKYIADTIESILNQTLQNFEFIIVNDASTDNTESIIRTYMKNDSRIKLINNEINSERSFSRNKGLEIARGESISIVDADDISLSEKLEKQVKFLDENQDVGFVGTSWYTIDENGCELSFHQCPDSSRKEAVHFTCFPSIMVRKECLDAIGTYRAVFEPAEDYDLWLRVAEKYNIGNIKEPLFKYRVHGESSTAKQKLQMDIGTSLALEMADERRKNGRDKMSLLSLSDAKKIRDQMLKASELRMRKMLSRNYTVWGRAAFSIGDYRRARDYSRLALISYVINFEAGMIFMKVLMRSVLDRFKKMQLFKA